MLAIEGHLSQSHSKAHALTKQRQMTPSSWHVRPLSLIAPASTSSLFHHRLRASLPASSCCSALHTSSLAARTHALHSVTITPAAARSISSAPSGLTSEWQRTRSGRPQLQLRSFTSRKTTMMIVCALPGAGSAGGSAPDPSGLRGGDLSAPDASTMPGTFSKRQLRKLLGRRGSASGAGTGGLPSPAGGAGSAVAGGSGSSMLDGGLGSGGGGKAGRTAATATGRASVRGHGSNAVAVVVERPASEEVAIGGDGGSDTDSVGSSSGSNIVPLPQGFSSPGRQPRALVLDCAYRPINVITWFRAFHFDYFGKGEVLEYYPPPAVCITGNGEHPLPAVLRVPQYTADMQDLCSKVVCTRRNVMVRDGFTCQYCGSKRDLTIDHVHPQSKGGQDTWENLVAACMRCNQKKGDKTLKDMGWKLRKTPKEPSPYEIGIVAGISNADLLRPPAQWLDYIQPYREKLEKYREAAAEAGLEGWLDD